MNQHVYITVNQHIKNPHPYKQTGISCLVVTPFYKLLWQCKQNACKKVLLVPILLNGGKDGKELLVIIIGVDS